MGITRGADQWIRLSRVLEPDISRVWERVGGENHQISSHRFRESVRFFHDLVQQLIADCHKLPKYGPFKELTKAYGEFVEKYFLPTVPEDFSRGGEESAARNLVLSESIQGLFTHLKEFDVLEESISWEEWTDVYFQVIDESSVQLAPHPHQGVRFLDAMAARGLPFRAMFIIGLNEQVFPRYIREDAFLRDRHRRVLAETLGYKIDEKLSGYDEEQLLFSLLQQATKDRLFLSYQRADEDGRPLVPSSFLRHFCRKHGLDLHEMTSIFPRRFSDRLTDPLFRESLLTPDDLGVKLILGGFDPSELQDMINRDSSIFQQGWNVLSSIEHVGHECGAFDGMVGLLEDYWEELTVNGVSPTALEGYARCPFQFFASHILRLRARRDTIHDELSPSVVGTLCHAVLHQVYDQLIEQGWSDSRSPLYSYQSLIASITEDVFQLHANEYSTGHWVTWELLKDMVSALVLAEVEANREEFARSGFAPMAVEVDAEGSLALPGLLASGLKIHGRLDRVDVGNDSSCTRIIDYKFKTSPLMKSQERDLLASGVRGHYLQPPLYSLMSLFTTQKDGRKAQHKFSPERVDFVYLSPRRESPVERSGFERKVWESGGGQQLQTTLTTLVNGAKAGEYFILPGTYCDHCSVSSTCRRLHRPTWSRAYRTEQSHSLRNLRKQEIVRD